MQDIIDLFHNLTDQEWLLAHGGLYIVMAIIFAETGLFIGFFLPGDYLLFVTGLLLNGYNEPISHSWGNMFFWSTLIVFCAVIGNFVGYWFGYKSGDYLFRMKDRWYLKKKHLIQARNFYEKRGGMAIVIARFLPIVRTFAPIIAGVVKMNIKKFAVYNIIGAMIWVYGIVSIGFLLGENEWVKNNLEKVIIGIILITTGPVLFKMIFGKSIAETAHINPDDPNIEDLEQDNPNSI